MPGDRREVVLLPNDGGRSRGAVYNQLVVCRIKVNPVLVDSMRITCNCVATLGVKRIQRRIGIGVAGREALIAEAEFPLVTRLPAA